MLNKIELLLLEKTQNKRSKIFYTQWGLAKEYIPQVLTVIAHTFPHYSLHDRTHSDTIINNIVRIVGMDTIEKFSAIDLWLLLCSAYYHDIGMVVTSIDKEKVFKNNKFVEFILEVQDDMASPFHKYAMNLKVDGGKIYYAQMELNAESYESSRFLMAEFIRWEHAKRSKESIQNHESLNLPGDPIPKRIIDLLGTICSSHTKSFDDIMKLSFCEVGIDTEDCHPRYIACLLRLGDLLDMDSNRFSNILLNTLSSIPVDSVQHQKKHLSITNLRIDKKKIEATATCKEPQVADLATKWFKLLDNEILDQMKRWSDIVPDISYGFLPTLGDLKVVLADYDKINGKIRPKFDIDPKKSIELLQGTGIYDSPFQSIRELLQNATDATYLRLFAESELNEFEYTREQFIKDCKQYSIKIDIKKIGDKDNKIQWEIKIVDQGIGMCKDDLKYLIKTGSSSKNRDKVKMIKNMPEWMKPSGTFGIGFQSIFLIAPSHKVDLVTRKLNKEATLYVELHNPLGENEGTVRVKTDCEAKVKTGTTVRFIVEFEKMPEKVGSYSRQQYKKQTLKTISEYDFIKDEALDYDIAQLIDEIALFSKGSYIPILLNNSGDVTFDSTNKNGELKNTNDEFIKYFCARKNIEISISTTDFKEGGLIINYRNQIVERHSLDIKFLRIYANILEGNAKDILTLDRNSFKSNFRSKLKHSISNAALDILKSCYKKLEENEFKQRVSMFIQYYSSMITGSNKFTENEFSEWKDYFILFKSEPEPEAEIKRISLADIFEKYNEIIFDEDYSQLDLMNSDEDLSICIKCILYDYDEVFRFISHKAICDLSYFATISYQIYTEKSEENYKYYYNNAQITLSKEYKDDLIGNMKDWFSYYYKEIEYARSLMPCLKKYLSLELDTTYDQTLYFDRTFAPFAFFEYPKMICPYVVKNEIIEVGISHKLYDITYKNRADKSITKSQIEETYKEFIADTKNDVDEINKKTLMRMK